VKKPPAADEALLQSVYDALATALAGATCPRSTTCCRFGETGREPHVWPVEMRRVAKAVMRAGGRLTEPADPEDCPFLGPQGGCRIYADRPFGCRTYFCAQGVFLGAWPRAVVEREAKRLRTLSEAQREAELLPLRTALARWFAGDGRLRRDHPRPPGERR
jgi:hypothetical protein